MTALEYLQAETTLNRTAIAKLMYPYNSRATDTLSKKLLGKLKWTKRDEDAAVRVVKELKERIPY